MNVEFRKSSERDLLEINQKSLLEKIQATIELVETIAIPSDILKIKTKGNYYRIRIGNYSEEE